MAKYFTLVFVVFLALSGSSTAETKLPPDEEVRARALFTELRCVVCQNQSIDSSDADVAKDLRQIVRELIQGGKTNAEVRSFLVARYGEFILLKPAFSWHTSLLWGAPILLLLGGGLLAWRTMKSKGSHEVAGLSVDEEKAVSDLLGEDQS